VWGKAIFFCTLVSQHFKNVPAGCIRTRRGAKGREERERDRKGASSEPTC